MKISEEELIEYAKPVLKEQGFVDLENIERILIFYQENSGFTNPDKYGTIAEETDRYLMIQNGILPDDFKEFAEEKNASALAMNEYYEGNLTEDYKRKKLGNIGEIYTFENLPAMFYNYNITDQVFVARDHGNGYGYDIYASDGTQELLIEVKSTTHASKTCFYLTSTELATMRLAIGFKNVSYIVPLLHVNFEEHRVTAQFFEAINDTTFKEIKTGEVFTLSATTDKGTKFSKLELVPIKNKQ